MSRLHRPRTLTLALAAVAVGLLSPAAPRVLAQNAAAPPAQNPWTTTTSIALRESFDSNVYMQRETARANQESLVTAITPSLGVSWKPSDTFSLAASYAPEIAFYHSESSEDYVSHKGALNFSGKAGKAAWDLGNALIWTDGDELSPTFTGAGGSAIIGGVLLLERRDQLVLRQNFKVQIPAGSWFVRPVATTYFHDFKTKHRTTAGYQNYVDRNDVGGGVDLGVKVNDKVALVAGYRLGAQDQSASPVSAFQYDNTYQRVLGGVEGTPFSWLKLTVLAGPDFRDFEATVPATFDGDKVRLFVDGSATLTLAKADTLTLTAKRFVLPGYGGGSFFEISAYDAAWKHKFTDAFSGGFSFRAHNWDFADPVKRNEWWYGAGVSASYAVDKHFSLDAAYALDSVESEVPATSGREATRHLLSLTAKYTF